MADGDKFLYTGALLYCDKGCLVLPFIAMPKKHFLYGPNIGTTKDCIPILNIPTFGICTVTRFACIPMLPQWEKYHDGALWIEKFRPLLVTSQCRCQSGGIIRIFDTRNAALSAIAAANSLKDNWAVAGEMLLKELDQQIGNILLAPALGGMMKLAPGGDNIVEALGRGVRKGVVDTVVGIYDLVTTNPLETLGGLATIVGVATVGYGKYANIPAMLLPDPAGETAEERLANFDGVFGTNLSATHEGIKEAVVEKGKEFDEADPMKKAEMIAEMEGYGAVILVDAIWGSKSASKFSKAAKASKLGRVAQTSKFGQMFSKIATKTSELADILKQAAKNKAKSVYDKLKDAVKGVFRVKKRKLKYQPTSGAILEATLDRTTTIIGNYMDDMCHIVDELGNVKSYDFGPKIGDFNILNVPDKEFANLGAKKFWDIHNEPWLQQAVNRGDIIKVATEPTHNKLYRIDNVTGKEELTGFGKEYDFLRRNGYEYDSATKQMVKNKE